MARTPARPILDPRRCLLVKGRFYIQDGKYPQIAFFTTYVTELDLVESSFGGKHYRHNKGWMWLLARREDVILLIETLMPDVLPGGPLDKAVKWYQKEREAIY